MENLFRSFYSYKRSLRKRIFISKCVEHSATREHHSNHTPVETHFLVDLTISVCVGDSITFATVEGEKFEKNANMGFGDYPAEYNPKIHGIYDPARFYGKREYQYRRDGARIFKIFPGFLLSAIMQ